MKKRKILGITIVSIIGVVIVGFIMCLLAANLINLGWNPILAWTFVPLLVGATYGFVNLMLWCFEK